MAVPNNPKIYHIVHFDRLPSIIAAGGLWCDAKIEELGETGTTIGMSNIKKRRLGLKLTTHPTLNVGECVPFYFCPRSVMLYVIYRGNDPELAYRGGQGPIVHLEADLRKTVAWAEQHNLRWAFTLSNAGAYYFEDRCDLGQLSEINWSAVRANKWSGIGVPVSHKEGKQAEFLIERQFPWELISRIGVYTSRVHDQTLAALEAATHKPPVEIKRDWYY